MLNGDEPATSSLLYLLSTRGTQCNLSSRSLLADHKRWNSFLCFSLKSEPRKHHLSSLPVRKQTLQLVWKLPLIFSNLSPAVSPRNVQCKLSPPFSTQSTQCKTSSKHTMQPASTCAAGGKQCNLFPSLAVCNVSSTCSPRRTMCNLFARTYRLPA